MLKFLIVGTLRSGSGYMASVLSRMGLACGHGWAYPPDQPRRYPEVDLLGDASPTAAAWVPEFGGLVLHQVRHPLAVIGSLLGAPPTPGEGGYPFPHQRLGLEEAIRYYVAWNQRCERHYGYLRYQVESVDRRLLQKVADLVGRSVDVALVEQALQAVPTNLRTRYARIRLDWDDLPAGPLRDPLVKIARRYGYRDATNSTC